MKIHTTTPISQQDFFIEMQTAMKLFAEAEEWYYSFVNENDPDRQPARANLMSAINRLDKSMFATGFFNTANTLGNIVDEEMVKTQLTMFPNADADSDDWEVRSVAKADARRDAMATMTRDLEGNKVA